MSTTVTMEFGDGTWHEVEVEADDPEEAVQEAKEWILDNVLLTVMDEDGLTVLAQGDL